MTLLGPETTEFFNRTAAATNPTSCDLNSTSCDLNSTSCDLNSTSCDMNSTSCDLNMLANHMFTAFYSLVFLAGLLLNGLMLKVYFCRPVKTCSLRVYLKNLVAADFLLCLCLPLRVARFASGSPLVQRAYCHFGAATFYLNMYASILFMGYVAGNRYLKIVHPLGSSVLQTVRAARLVSMVTWAFLLAVTTAYVALSLTQRDTPAREAILRCEDLYSRQLKTFYRVAHGGLAAVFLLVLGSLLFFYHRTTRRLAEAQRRQPASSRSSRLARGRRNMLVLVGVFCVCFVPYHLVRLPYAFWWGRSRPPCHAFYLKELTTMLSVLNVCLDPLIYFLFCKAVRTQVGRRGAGLARHLGALQVEFSSTQANNTQERRSSDFRVMLKTSGNINLGSPAGDKDQNQNQNQDQDQTSTDPESLMNLHRT